MKASFPSVARPRVICHMMTLVDGRIVTADWPLSTDAGAQYEQVHATYEADAWICGRVTMEEDFAAGARTEDEIALVYEGPARDDFIAQGAHESCAIALDPGGRLVWESGVVNGDHVVAVLTHRVSDEYLAALRERGVSYLLAGDVEVDLQLALEKIGGLLGVRTLMLEGGGGINGSFLRAGLIDELSLLIAPVADGRAGTPALFDIQGESSGPHRLRLENVEVRSDDMLWLRYRMQPGDAQEQPSSRESAVRSQNITRSET